MNSGLVLKSILEEKGLKQSWLAKNLDMKESSLTVRLKKELTLDFLIKICNLANIDFNYFLANYFDKQKEMSSASGKILNSSHAQTSIS